MSFYKKQKRRYFIFYEKWKIPLGRAGHVLFSLRRFEPYHRSLRLWQDHRLHQQNRPAGLLSAESPLFDRH